MRNTFTECKARGDRNQEAGLRIRKARILNGGWYENRASDFTLEHCHVRTINQLGGQYSIPFDGCNGILEKILEVGLIHVC